MSFSPPGPVLDHLTAASSRQGWLRHLVFALSLVVVALSVVGMHQLSLGHDLVTGQASQQAPAQAGSPAADTTMLMPAAPPGGSAGLTSTTGGSSGEHCPGCGDDQMALGTCLAALTLLMLSWTLAAPRLRHLPPFLRPRLAPTMVGPALGRLVPPLSLVELSLRRT